jgi:phosphate transport system substrate-binding protein
VRRVLTLLFLSVIAVSVQAQTKLNGAGATFPNPIYSKWFSEYHNAHPDVEINYQPIGSGGGIRQVTAGTVDFGASDGPMTDQQLADYKGKLYHIPTVLGSVVPAYNIPGVKSDLKFSGPVLANIFLGKITSWNDAALTKENPDAKLPNLPIVVVHRSDSSGTTYVWTDYLSKVNQDWQVGPGKSTAVKWPLGIGAKGNEGVAGMVRQTEGSIGYIELIYAEQNKIPYGTVKNAAGAYVKASLASTTAAAAAVKMPADYRASITNATGKDAYPIASFTWLLIPAHNADANKQRIIIDFLNWMVNDGQKMTTQLTYAPLPPEVAGKVKATIASIK